MDKLQQTQHVNSSSSKIAKAKTLQLLHQNSAAYVNLPL